MAVSLSIARPKDLWPVIFFSIHALLALASVLVLQVQPPLPSEAYRLDNAVLVEETQAIRPVVLPHHQQPSANPGEVGTYRLAFDHSPADGDRPWSIFISRFTAGVEVSVNGTVIADTRRDQAAGRPDRNVPLIAEIPAPLLRDGGNELAIRVFVWGPLTGYLANVFAGPDELLRPAYDGRVFLFMTLPLILTGWQGTIGIILSLIWIQRRQDSAYGALAAAMLAGVVQSMIPMPSAMLFHTLLAASVSLEGAFVVLFAVRLTGRGKTRLTWLPFIPALIIILGGLLGGPAWLKPLYLALGPLSIGVCIVLTWLVLISCAVTRRDSACMYLSLTFTMVLAFWIHDILMLSDAIGPERLFVARLSYSAVLVAIGIWLTWRFTQALNEADSFANRLVRQVGEAEEKLRASFAREEERARAEALASERTRLMRDLHDGLGGQLVSIVALAEQSGSASGPITDAARAALKDLRLVIDSMEEIDGDLMLALATWRERIAAQLRAHDIELAWSVSAGGLPLYPDLRPAHVIHIIRLLDEAVTNAVKHAGADTVAITIRSEPAPDEGTIGRIIVADDGHGFETSTAGAQPVHRGRGLLNMRRRADQCGATVDVQTSSKGTIVSLTLPPDFPRSGSV